MEKSGHCALDPCENATAALVSDAPTAKFLLSDCKPLMLDIGTRITGIFKRCQAASRGVLK
jgi:hypothetical protein